ncbi:MAG: NADH-quinone oxidoreductase subunit M, partial [Cytophagaceae bacterium]
MILSLLIFLPLLGALIVALLPDSQVGQYRRIALVVTLAEVVLAGLAYAGFNKTIGGYQLLEQANWITLPLGNLGVVSI